MQSKITIQVHKYSSKASLNKNVFKFFLKLGKDGERRTSDGNLVRTKKVASLTSVMPMAADTKLLHAIVLIYTNICDIMNILRTLLNKRNDRISLTTINHSTEFSML